MTILDIHPDVEEAIKNESQLSHSSRLLFLMECLTLRIVETAMMVEETVRSNKAVPATIAIINGRLKVGLTHEEIEFLATNDEVRKVSQKRSCNHSRSKALWLNDSCSDNDHRKAC